MSRTTPVIAGWITLTRALGTNLPLADTTMSSRPNIPISTATTVSSTRMRLVQRGAG